MTTVADAVLSSKASSGAAGVAIDLKLRTIAQLFDSRDPSPFLERDLDDRAVEYIVSATTDHPSRTPIKIVIHLSDPAALAPGSEVVVEAISHYFEYNAEMIRAKVRRIWRQGQFSLVIGFAVLFVCLTAARRVSPPGDLGWRSILREGLVIMGWVAMWRPIDVFLYSWWPQYDLRRIYLKLARVPVEFVIGSQA